MQLPAELLKYFGLPYDVRAGDIGITQLWSESANNFVQIHPDARIAPGAELALAGAATFLGAATLGALRGEDPAR